MEKKYYSIELNHVDSFKLKWFLSEHHIKYESSECYNLIHFEICCDKHEKDMLDSYLEMITKEGVE